MRFLKMIVPQCLCRKSAAQTLRIVTIIQTQCKV